MTGLPGWIVAAAAGLAAAALAYAGAGSGRAPALRLLAAALRALAAALLVALLLDLPIGPARVPAPLVALDVSASWLRGGDGAPYAAARDAARRASTGPPLLVGDSARAATAPEQPGDLASSVRTAVERAVAAGRTLVLHTDGELDDAAVLGRLPAGSRVERPARAPAADLAVLAVEAPRAAVGGDSVDVRVRVGAGDGGSAAASLRLAVDGAVARELPLDSLAAHAERTLDVRLPLPRREGAVLLAAAVAAAGDAEARNDTVTVALELSAAAGVTVVSTAPDLDLRYLLEVVRGTVALPTRAYLQVAPGQWRVEGSLAPVDAGTVRDAVRLAPIVVLHGDTAAFGPPNAAAQGALLLLPSVAAGEAEWYAVAAPPSPLAAAMSGAVWDSLPPLVVGGAAPGGEWVGLVAQRARAAERRPVLAGREQPRRRAVAGAVGFWRWRFRGGPSGDAFAALWGGTLDWLAAERRDARAVAPDAPLVRAGEPVRWRRGGADSLARVVLRRRGAADSVALEVRFDAGAAVAATPPLAAGVYDVAAPGGSSVLVVNASRELLPRRPAVEGGPVGGGPAPAGVAPAVRDAWWAYLLVVLLLCAEWLLRRRVGLR